MSKTINMTETWNWYKEAVVVKVFRRIQVRKRILAMILTFQRWFLSEKLVSSWQIGFLSEVISSKVQMIHLAWTLWSLVRTQRTESFIHENQNHGSFEIQTITAYIHRNTNTQETRSDAWHNLIETVKTVVDSFPHTLFGISVNAVSVTFGLLYSNRILCYNKKMFWRHRESFNLNKIWEKIFSLPFVVFYLPQV